MKFVTLFVILALILESTVTTLPLVLLTLLFGAVVTKSRDIFFIAFIAGIVLDVLTFRTVGLSSIYFLTFILTVYLYDRKFEISTVSFVAISSFISSFIYVIISNAGSALIQSIIASIIITSSYYAYRITNKKQAKYASYG